MGRITRLAVAIGVIGITLTVWGAFNRMIGKNPASTAAAKVETDKGRNLILGNAKGVKQSKKGEEESNVIMNDPAISEKWAYSKTDAKRAWNVSQGSKDIWVAIIDTGIDINHPDVKKNLWVNPGESGKDEKGRDKASNKIDDDKNGFVDDVNGWNFVANNNDLRDNHGHGTHIAGIVGAEGGNGIGISGISPNVSLMVLKYYDPKAPGANNLKNTVSAIKYAVQMKAHIVNYSGGGLEYSAEEFSAIKEAEKKGILFVAAAGNEKSNSDQAKYFPADYDLTNIISVTAIDPDIKVLSSSNYGVRTVDIAAPGENIYSTLPGNSFGYMTGTSQATAFVSGVAALVMAHNREFSAFDVKKYILRTGDEYPSLRSKTGTSKKLNSYKALTSLDQGVGATGVIAENTSKMGARNFASDSNARDRRVETTEETGGTEEITSFGKDLLKALQNPNVRDDGAVPNAPPK